MISSPVPYLGYPFAALLPAVHSTQVPHYCTPGYPGAALLHALHTCRYRLSCCSFAGSYAFTQELNLSHPGAGLLQALHTTRYLLPGILVQACFTGYTPNRTFSWLNLLFGISRLCAVGGVCPSLPKPIMPIIPDNFTH